MAMVDLKDKDNTKVLKIQGSLSIGDASTLRDCILGAYDSKKDLLIDLTAVQTIDLSCIQVLCSAHKTFLMADMQIHISGKLAQGVKTALRNIGLVPESCDIKTHGTCLWATGE